MTLYNAKLDVVEDVGEHGRIPGEGAWKGGKMEKETARNHSSLRVL